MKEINLKLTPRGVTLLVAAINEMIDLLNKDIENPDEEDWWKNTCKNEIEKYESMRRDLLSK